MHWSQLISRTHCFKNIHSPSTFYVCWGLILMFGERTLHHWGIVVSWGNNHSLRQPRCFDWSPELLVPSSDEPVPRGDDGGARRKVDRKYEPNGVSGKPSRWASERLLRFLSSCTLRILSERRGQNEHVPHSELLVDFPAHSHWCFHSCWCCTPLFWVFRTDPLHRGVLRHLSKTGKSRC